jgi:Sulfotransferase domain
MSQMSVKWKVFGIGLNKTGTTTLAECLRHLGYRHMGCRRDLLLALRENRIAEVFAVTDEYESFADWPYPLAYAKLFERYDDARFVLTTRSSARVWLESLKAHSLHTDPANHCRNLAYGYDYPHGFEAEHIALYEEHNTAVRAFFKTRGASHRLLCVCWENGHGWRELCEFIGHGVPAIPFPHANRKKAGSPRMAENERFVEQQLASRSGGRGVMREAE